MGSLKYPADVGEGAITACIEIQEMQRIGIKELVPSNTITLYMPNNIENPNTVIWEEGSERTLSIEAASGGLGALSDLAALGKGRKSKVVSDILGYAGKGISGAAGIADSDLTSFKTRTIQNPYTIMLFKSVSLREFKFDFEFYPKSQSEAGVIWNIVNTLKKGALPKEDAGSITLSYPNEYKLRFIFNGKQNPFMPKFKQCVITDINANYTGQSVFAMTREGAPAEVKLSISFKEIEILTQTDYNDSMSSVSDFLNTMGVSYVGAVAGAAENLASDVLDTTKSWLGF